MLSPTETVGFSSSVIQSSKHRKGNSANNIKGAMAAADPMVQKYVKPSELNLDFINPNSKGKGGHQYQQSMGPVTSNHQMSSNSNVQNILNNLRTP